MSTYDLVDHNQPCSEICAHSICASSSSTEMNDYVLTETQIFVDKLFEALISKSYQPHLEQLSSGVRAEGHHKPDKEEPRKDEVMIFQADYNLSVCF